MRKWILAVSKDFRLIQSKLLAVELCSNDPNHFMTLTNHSIKSTPPFPATNSQPPKYPFSIFKSQPPPTAMIIEPKTRNALVKSLAGNGYDSRSEPKNPLGGKMEILLREKREEKRCKHNIMDWWDESAWGGVSMQGRKVGDSVCKWKRAWIEGRIGHVWQACVIGGRDLRLEYKMGIRERLLRILSI